MNGWMFLLMAIVMDAMETTCMGFQMGIVNSMPESASVALKNSFQNL
jgi:hypothetical protein